MRIIFWKHNRACVAVCCTVLQCIAVWGDVLQCITWKQRIIYWYHIRASVAVRCSVLQCVAVVAVCCSVLQCVAVCDIYIQTHLRIAQWDLVVSAEVVSAKMILYSKLSCKQTFEALYIYVHLLTVWTVSTLCIHTSSFLELIISLITTYTYFYVHLHLHVYVRISKNLLRVHYRAIYF